MAIDSRMDSKRKTRREALLKEELAKDRKKRPRIQEQFRDIKHTLNTVSEVGLVLLSWYVVHRVSSVACEYQDQWESIPEPLDYSRRNRRENRASKYDRSTPVPDHLIGGFSNPHNAHTSHAHAAHS